MHKQRTILIVEDEAPIRDMLRYALQPHSFVLYEAEDAQTAYRQIYQVLPDLILLDWMLPGESGIDFAKRLKRDELSRDIPIIMLTARAEEDNKIKGLSAGADDYVVKPFSPRELIARINAVLRRGPMILNDKLVAKDLVLDIQIQQVTVKQQIINLGPLEFKLLVFFMRHPGRIYSREQLLDKVWGTGVYIDERTVDVTVKRLRQALRPTAYDQTIKTIRGSGYLFDASLAPVST
ncbi:MAG: phosphate response regulator transcription factor PhoB [Gammaproteobacteria bacterium]